MFFDHNTVMKVLLASHGAELAARQVTCVAATSAPWLSEAGLAQPEVCELCALHCSWQSDLWVGMPDKGKYSEQYKYNISYFLCK